jgi:hypothetical protein
MAADECNIKVVCRIRPLNESEERAGSKFVLKFPTDDSIACGVRFHRFWRVQKRHVSPSINVRQVLCSRLVTVRFEELG